jgi:hypothetical protein
MPAKVVLQVASGPLSGQRFEFDRHDTFIFGRSKDCHARLPKDDPLSSRHHFILEANPPDACLRDLGSLNGTLINNIKHGGRQPHESPEEGAARNYPQISLRNGDRITVGNTELTVAVELPPLCRECQAELPAEAAQAANANGNGLLCHTCQINPATQAVPDVAEVPSCDRCGKDVAAELKNGRRGEYVCHECQAAAFTEDGGLRKLLLDAARKLCGQGLPQIDGYEIGKELGRGGMGVVYKARNKKTGAVVAIKVLLAKIAVSRVARKGFLREIDALQRLRHPLIVPLLEHGEAGSAFFFVMDFCAEGTLSHLAERTGGTLPIEQAAPLMVQCLQALEHAHQQKFVHRDLKPENVLLERRGGALIAKLSDFGLAKSFEHAGFSGMTATGTAGGTFPFMPREQLTNYKYVRPVSDVWSMAATFYKILSGHFPLPFTPGCDPVRVILREDPVPLYKRAPRIPRAVCQVIDRALTMDPLKRYQSAGDFLTALQNALPKVGK